MIDATRVPSAAPPRLRCPLCGPTAPHPDEYGHQDGFTPVANGDVVTWQPCDGCNYQWPYTLPAVQGREDVNNMLDAALGYRTQGWSVFPLHALGKLPLVKWKHLQTTPAPAAQIRMWWRRWPDANIGIITGPVSGLLVVDIDIKHGGIDTIAKLEATRGSLITMEATTATGGAHLLFRYPDGADLGNTAGKLGPGVDTRGAGGMIVAAPSRRPQGTYTWCTGHGTIEPPPAWLVEALTPPAIEPGTAVAPVISIGDGRKRRLRYFEAAIRGEVESLAAAIEGTRHNMLRDASIRLGQLTAEQAPADYISAVLTNLGDQMGLDPADVRAAVRDGLAYGREHPRRRESGA